MKNKKLKIMLIISCIPYILVLLSGILCAIFGVTIFFNKIQGMDAFLLGVMALGYLLIFYVPIIPVCLIFQVACLIKSKFGLLKQITTKKYIIICSVIVVVVVVGLLINSFSYEIESFFEKQSAKKMIKNAEEEIVLSTSTVVVGGIFDIEGYEYECVFVDYDKMEVGFLLKAGFDTFWKERLEEYDTESKEYYHIIDEYFVQAVIPLEKDNGTLICFSTEADHLTVAMMIIYDDGTVYLVDDIREDDGRRYTGLNQSKFRVEDNVKFRDLEIN